MASAMGRRPVWYNVDDANSLRRHGLVHPLLTELTHFDNKAREKRTLAGNWLSARGLLAEFIDRISDGLPTPSAQSGL
jgi:hypothetical protein